MVNVITLEFIKKAHAGQYYGSQPYFNHPVEVMHKVDALCSNVNNPELNSSHVTINDWFKMRKVMMQVALLHDVIEDTIYTADTLRLKFSSDVVTAVELLTKDVMLSYRSNIQRIIDSANIIAMFVKLADNLVNRSNDKTKFSLDKAMSLNARYDMSIDMLKSALKLYGYNLHL